jgi:acetyltransferase-like isoleucine patch superfamily enzyme
LLITIVFFKKLNSPRIGKGVYINFNATFLDTCLITIGARTLIGPNCSFYSATHPLDPFLRNGTKGPECGKSITVGEDCWFGGNVIVLPGVTVGRGCSVGAGSVVAKDVPDFHCVAGNPARIIRRIEPKEPDPTLPSPN